MVQKVFITGISGCVGHYLFDLLVNDKKYELYLLVRNPQKLKFSPQAFPGVHLIADDLKNIQNYADLIQQMDYVIHLAADWGGNEGNYDYSLALFNLLDPNHCKKVIYFSTASILDQDNRPMEEAEKYGTHYIRSKYRFHKKLPELKIFPKVITLFPTWILGGDKDHPYSHAAQGILDLRKFLRLIRFFKVDAAFHFIHAKDIAAITRYLLENETDKKEFVLGNPSVSAEKFIKEVCNYFKVPIYFQIPINLTMVKLLAFLTGRRLHPWDIFCFNKRNFTYRAVNGRHFRLSSNLETVPQILADTAAVI